MRVARGFPLTRLSHDDILTRHEFLRHERGGGLNEDLMILELPLLTPGFIMSTREQAGGTSFHPLGSVRC